MDDIAAYIAWNERPYKIDTLAEAAEISSHHLDLDRIHARIALGLECMLVTLTGKQSFVDCVGNIAALYAGARHLAFFGRSTPAGDSCGDAEEDYR